ncbi:MAG: L-lactate dehydrogenase [Erysipelotrichaceae bacterium]|nr:L-lactate dehydrogenase [Erysipelotrichaceae bacterium]
MNKKRNFVTGNRKVAIIGAGYVGSTIAYALALRDIAREIALIDINEEKTLGEVKDIRHGIPILGTTDVYVGDYSDCENCDLIIIAAGRNRRNNESRLDLTNDNIKIIRSVVDSIKKYYTRGVIVIVSNPVDILTYKVSKWMDLPDGMVFGTGCILDTSRFVRSISDYVGVSTGVISAYVIGEHGDGQVPIWSHVTISGIGIEEYCESVGLQWNEQIKKDIAEKTKNMGASIIAAKGRTHYGIATCVCVLADAIINQRPTIVPVSSVLKGENGVNDVALSVPSVIGPGGVQLRIKERWSQEEYQKFLDSAQKISNKLKEFA